MVLWRPTRPSRTNTPQKCPFHHRKLECKVGSEEILGITGKFGLGVQDEKGWRLTEFCQENALVIAWDSSSNNMRQLHTWTSPDGQYWSQIDYILCSRRWRSSIQLAKTSPGHDCWSDHELLITKFRLKLKKVGKTTRPLRYDLNQWKWQILIQSARRTMDGGSWHCTGGSDQDHPQEEM